MNVIWIAIVGAVTFRLLECVVKVVKTTGKWSIKAIVKEFFTIS